MIVVKCRRPDALSARLSQPQLAGAGPASWLPAVPIRAGGAGRARRAG
jgi:hypothetical protein